MLSTREEILSTAKDLVSYLRESYRDTRGKEWTTHIFDTLRSFCEANLTKDCYHRGHPDGKSEFLWDFIATTQERGILLAVESEQKSKGKLEIESLKHDFEKLLYVFAPIRVLICKGEHESATTKIVEVLNHYGNGCCRNFNPGAVFILHVCLWNEKGSKTYIWQSEGDPSEPPSESLKFQFEA